MKEFFDFIIKTPLPKILVLFGAVFIFLGLGGKFTKVFITDNIHQNGMILVGSIMFLLGLVFWFKTLSSVNSSLPDKLELTVDSKQSGSIFVDLKTGERKRFGNNDTKHNRYCWIGRYNNYVCKSFVCFELNIDPLVRKNAGKIRASFYAPDYEIRDEKNNLNKLGPLILYYFDYGQYATDMNINIMDNGTKLKTIEDITVLKTGIDITNTVRRALNDGNSTFKVAFVYPGDARNEDINAKILIDPQKCRVTLELK